MTERATWTREQLLVAFYLYCQLPFGKMHRGNPDVIRYAALIDRTPSALAMKLTNIASLDPAITSTGRRGLQGASALDRAMWEEMQSDWSRFARRAEEVAAKLRAPTPGAPREALDTEGIERDYTGRDRLTTAKVRLGQAFFRNSVLSAYDYRCCISGLSIPGLLVASHIVPWRADTRNRLNPRNGLCLSVLHDKAFDLGLICVTSDMKVRVSTALGRFSDSFAVGSLMKFAGEPLRLPQKFAPDAEFLAFHRENVFRDER